MFGINQAAKREATARNAARQQELARANEDVEDAKQKLRALSRYRLVSGRTRQVELVVNQLTTEGWLPIKMTANYEHHIASHTVHILMENSHWEQDQWLRAKQDLDNQQSALDNLKAADPDAADTMNII